jgi:hypothetical protein
MKRFGRHESLFVLYPEDGERISKRYRKLSPPQENCVLPMATASLIARMREAGSL